MDNTHIHQVRSKDGTRIVGKVIGTGAPLVLLPLGPAECEQGWEKVLPFLQKRFTCYLLNPRGRGMSDDHSDHSPVKLVGDVIAFAKSIGQPVTLAEGGSSLWAYAAAENHPAIGAAVVYEPGVDEVMPETLAVRLEAVFVRVAELAAGGRLVEAAEYFIENSHIIYSEEELATGVPRDFWLAAAENIPAFLAGEAERVKPGVPSPTGISVLSKINIPVLILKGSRTEPWFVDSVKYVAKHVRNSHVQDIDQAAHFGFCTHPEAFVDQVTKFLTSI